MTAQFLQSELTNLVQEAKRKNSELRHATEKSLADLRSINAGADVNVVLSSKPGFLTPFFIACSTRNAKFSTIAVVCLQRLIVSKALATSRLKEVLEAFREAANLGVDIQLKILQALPSLSQNYADYLQGTLLNEVLLICSILQGSKMGVVNNTAAATLSQIVISIFDKVVAEDEKQLEIPTVGEAPSESGNIAVRPAALDAYRVFHDICALTEGQSPRYLQFRSLPQPFGLELIESVLTNHPEIFLSHPEQAQILRKQVAPLIMRAIADRLSFPTTVRITRVLYILLRRHLSILSEECERALSQLTQMLEPDNFQPWKRALCMEVFRGICAEPALIRKIFSTYDAQEGKKKIVQDLVGALTRLTQEKPSLIGLGSQSTAPGQSQKDMSSEQAALEAGGVAGIIGGAVGLSEVAATGLSTQWSLVRVPCIDQLDKTEPPAIPESYVYCLTLTCINSFSEGLAKFILPIVSGQEGRRRALSRTASAALLTPTAGGSDSETASPRVDSPTRTPSPAKSAVKKKSFKRLPRVPVNLLSLESHPQHTEIKTCAAIIEECWPAVLAACSTFLYATLDNDLYHGLVRGFQKFTQVAGLLRLITPRDAFLTTLGKAAVPSNIVSANLPSVPSTPSTWPSGDQSLFANAKGFLGVESSGSGSDRTSTSGTDSNSRNAPSLNSRNLLCLRALLNLGIVLGPTLGKSWTIVLESLQRADYVLFASSRRSGRQLSLSASSARSEIQKSVDSDSYLMANIGPELSAVEAAAAKMFEGTRDFPDEAFVDILAAVCKLLNSFDQQSNGRPSLDNPLSPTGLSPAPRSPTIHKRTTSASSLSMTSQIIGDNTFALAKMGDLAQINMTRIIGPNPTTTGWDILMSHLIAIVASRDMGNSLRMKAAEVLYDVVVSATKAAASAENAENVGEVQRRILAVLKQGVDAGNRTAQPDSATKATELEIHRAGLDALNAILEHSGQSLVAGWEIVFDVIASVFDASMVWRRDSTKPRDPSPAGEATHSQKSTRLIRTSFSSLELICSDFLTSLPTSCVLVLVDALFAFSSQKDDLNISLTTITFFWNVSDFLQSKGDAAAEALTGDAETEKDLLDIVERADVASHAALWMLLLLRLTGVSKDSRAEVRNGSIQTLFRIFDTYGHQLGPHTWSCCLKIVVFKMMNINPRDITFDPSSRSSERKQWDDTIKLILTGIGTLYSNYFDTFRQQADFRKTWSVFVQYLQSLLSRKSLEVSTTVFQVLSQVLGKVQSPSDLDVAGRDEVWALWTHCGINIVEGDLEIPNTGNPIQETIVSYVEAFKALYRLLEPALTAEIVQKALEILRECILFPDAPSYFQDVEILTPLQAVILEAVQLIRTDISCVPSLVLKQLAEFSTVAYSSRPPSKNKNKIPSYIALSTYSVKVLQSTALKHIADEEIYTSALADVLAALAVPIHLKYAFTPQLSTGAPAKRLSQWLLATTVVLQLLQRALPAMDALPTLAPPHREAVWSQIVSIVSGVVAARETAAIATETLRKDEAFDIAAFGELRELVVPALGRKDVPLDVVEAYVKAVFTASLLYPIDEQEIEQDAGDMTVRLGKTEELRPVRRSRMAYVCLDELFALVAGGGVEQDGEEVRRLAEVAAPWFIKRVRIVLAGYVADQPLRGLMPMPSCQRKEILYVIKRTIALRCAADAGETTALAIGQNPKWHMFKLLPLISQSIPIASQDPELLRLLSGALNEMAGVVGLRG